MPSPLSSSVASRLDKAAVDNGVDRELPTADEWLAFASTQCPLSIWLGMTMGAAFAIALSQHNVAVALGTFGELLGDPQGHRLVRVYLASAGPKARICGSRPPGAA